jgi:hypothetical protein
MCALGRELSPAACGKLAGTNATRGTTIRGMTEAVIALGYAPVTLHTGDQNEARSRLFAHLHQGHPLVLSVDDDSHWVAAVGLLGPRVLVADSGGIKCVEALDWPALRARWEVRGKRKGYFALAIAC